MDKLEDFLTKLATDPQTLGQFIHDPDAAMNAANLSNEEQAALRTGFPDLVDARLAGVPITQAFQVSHLPYYIIMPPPPPESEPPKRKRKPKPKPKRKP